MLFSAHLVDTTPLAAIRRSEPVPGVVPGLKSARTAVCAPFTPGVLPRPQLGRECLLGCWDDEAALDAFLADDPTGRVFAPGWHVRLQLVRATGVWPGVDDDMVAEAGDRVRGLDGPVVTITIGTAYVKTMIPFVRVNNGLEDQFLADANGLWGTLMTNLPKRMVATLTVWTDARSSVDYMRSGAHAQAMADHYDPAKDPTGHTFVTGGGFFAFRPISTHGAIGGRNGIPDGLFQQSTR